MSISATRRTCRLHRTHILRSLSTREPPRASAPRRQWQPEENLQWLHPRMIFVRPWDGLPTMAHAFAIIREIERRFGKIQEFVVLRDSDVLTRNMPYLHATFARAEYTDAIPIEGRVIQVRMPTTDPDRPGGVGLDDLEEYLDQTARPEELSEPETDAEGTAPEAGPQVDMMMDVKLERTGMRTAPSPIDVVLGSKPRIQGAPLLRNSARAGELAELLHAFGGFATPPREPSDINKPKTRMQLLLKRWEIPQTKFQMVPRQPAPPREKPDKDSRSDPEPEPVPWTPFKDQQEASASESLPLQTPVSSEPISSNSRPTPLPIPTIPPETTTSENPSITFRPTPPAPESNPPAPKVSRKQRMLLAARVAGAKAASQPAVNDYGSLQRPTESPAASNANTSAAIDSASDPAAESIDKSLDKRTSENGADDVAKQNENNQLATKWWAFLTGKK